MSRIIQQLNILIELETAIPKPAKITITPTRIKIKSNESDNAAFRNQVEAVNQILDKQGLLPFNVEIIPHG